jgi:hypothetical protein
MQLDGRGLVAVNNVDSSYSRLEDIGDLKVAEPCSYKLGESRVDRIPRQSSLAASYSHVIAATEGTALLCYFRRYVGDIGVFKVAYIDEDGEDGSNSRAVPTAVRKDTSSKFFSVTTE